jgi:hypothetical protein
MKACKYNFSFKGQTYIDFEQQTNELVLPMVVVIITRVVLTFSS